jgi:RNA-binding protein NOB1
MSIVTMSEEPVRAESKPVKFLVVDSSAFIKQAPIKDLTDDAYCVDGVVAEIRDETTRQSLQVLPYDLHFKNPTTESINFVSNFAKKTGDFYNLSAVDLQLIALSYQLCKENLPGDVFEKQLKKEPTNTSFVPQAQNEQAKLKLNKPVNVVGFYMPKKEKKTETIDIEKKDELDVNNNNNDNKTENQEISGKLNDLKLDKDDSESSDHINGVKNEEEKEEGEEEEEEDKEEGEEEEDKEEGEEEEDKEEDDDNDGWITPGNLAETRKQDNIDLEQHELTETMPVGCITSDFAMQNVLIQIGIPCLSIEGLMIRQARSYVLKCTACHKVTTDMSKVFCPFCSYKTLKRVLVTIDDNGNKVYRERRKPVGTKGTRVSKCY